jgi:ADP-heptose:LPS heptosyltransferase
VTIEQQKPESTESTERPLRYRLDRLIRNIAMGVISALASGNRAQSVDPRGQNLQRILLVRANFRIGNLILALPALAAFRKKFPHAKIDFVGSPVSRLLFQNQPLNEHYDTPRRFPWVLWEYVVLIRRLRAERYDLALDVSCSQSGLASFIVGLSGARSRAGCAGKWDRLLNFRLAKPLEINKYRKLTELLQRLGLDGIDEIGRLQFSAAEINAARAALEHGFGNNTSPMVGVFVGGRKLRGKRWPLENFIRVVAGLNEKGYRVVTFVGPEESDIINDLKSALKSAAQIVFEPSLRKFAAMVGQLDLFVCCDSGPMHLACAVGVRVVAIFRERDLARWAPPTHAARAVSAADGVSSSAVLSAALEELALASARPACHVVKV